MSLHTIICVFNYDIYVFVSFHLLSFPTFPLVRGIKLALEKTKFQDWKIGRKPTLKTGSSTSMMLHSFLFVFLRLFQRTTSGAGALNNPNFDNLFILLLQRKSRRQHICI